MAASTFFIPSVNVIGADSLNDAMNMMADYGFTRTLIVTDNMLTKLGMAGDVQKALEERNIFSVIYDGTQPKEGANKRGNSSRLTQSFHFFMFEPIFSPVNALNQPI